MKFLPMKNPILPIDACEDPIHIIVPGEVKCLCGEHVYEEPPFPANFWELLDEAFTDSAIDAAYGIDEEAPWTEKDAQEWEKLKQHAKNYGATLDIARYCKICGKSEYDCVYGDQAKAGFHGFVADIPYDWDGKL